MAEIDGSIPASAGKVPNQLQSLGEMATAIGAMNQNRLFMARQAAGQAVQQAIGPDGQLDPAKLNQLISQNPRIAPYASEALTQSLAQQGAGIANTGAGLSLQAAQGDRVRAMIGTLGPNATHDQVLGALSMLAQTRQIKDDFAANVAGNIPADPAQIAAWARNNFVLPALGPEGALSATNPKPTAINIGGKTLLVATPNKGFGEPTQEGEIANTLSPEAKAGRQNIVGPDNQEQSVPTSALVTETGNPKVSSLTGKHGEVNTGLSPGVKAAADTAAQGSAQQYNTDRTAAGNAQQSLLALKKIHELLPTTNTGPGTAVTNQVRSFLIAQMPVLEKIIPGLSAGKVQTAQYDELNKYLTAFAANAASPYGPGTDAKMAIAASANASTHISNLAARQVTEVNMALKRAELARVAAFDASGQPPQNYASFSANWARSIDPRAFMLDLMTAKDRAALYKGMKPAEQSQFRSSVRQAIATHMINPSDVQ